MPNVDLTIHGKNLSKQATDELKQQLKDTAVEMNNLNKAQAGVQDNSSKTNKSVGNLRTGMGGLAIVLGAVAATATMLARSFFQTAMEFESLNRGLTAVMGSSKLAAEEFKKLREVAKLPGLGMKEAVQGSTNLQAAGFSADLARRALMAFGNALATVGKGKADLAGVQLALTQIMAKGKVSAEEINQIAERVPQIRQAMIRALGTADTEILQKQKMNVTTFMKAIIGEMEKLTLMTSGTQNAVENFGDAMILAKAKMGETFVATVSKAMDTISMFLVRLTEMPEATRKTIAQLVIATAAIATFGASAIGIAMIMPQVIAGVKLLGTSLLWLSTNPIVAIVGILAVLAGYFIAQHAYSNMMIGDMTKVGKSFEYVTAEAEKMKKIDQLTKRFEELANRVNLTTKEEAELKNIKQQLIDISPRFISATDNETKSLKDQAEQVKITTEEYKKLTRERQQGEIAKAERELPKVEGKLADLRKKANDLRKGIEMDKKAIASPLAWNKEGLKNQQLGFEADLGRTLKSIEEFEGKVKEIKESIIGMKYATKEGTIMKLPPVRVEGATAAYVPTKADTDNIDKMKEYAIAQITDEHEKKRAEINKTYDDEIAKQNLARASVMKGKQDDKFWRERLKSIDDTIAAANQARQSELAQETKKENEDKIKAAEEYGKILEDQYKETLKNTSDLIKAEEGLQARDEARKQKVKEGATDRDPITGLPKSEIERMWKFRTETDEKYRKQWGDLATNNAAKDEARIAAIREYNQGRDPITGLTLTELEDIHNRIYEIELNAIVKRNMLDDKAQADFEALKVRIKEDRRDPNTGLTKAEAEQFQSDRIAIEDRAKKRTKDMVMDYATMIARIPYDTILTFKESLNIGREFAQQSMDLEQSRADAVRQVYDSEIMTAAEKARDIERIEEESARKRIQIEEELDGRRRELWTNFVKNFLMGILDNIMNNVEQKIALGITDALLKTQNVGGTGGDGGGFGGFLKSIVGLFLSQAPKIAMSAATGGVSDVFAMDAFNPASAMGFDNPYNDAMAKMSGRHAAMLRGVKFDNPVNDMMARMSGANSSSYAVGRRSAKDLVDNFSKGFVEKANTIGGTKNGNQDFDALVNALKDRLGDIPPLILQIDGKELRGILKRREDKDGSHKFAY